ncbi:MAG: hypothetical protein AAFO82_22580, partial [Bacteroidota bacterium]
QKDITINATDVTHLLSLMKETHENIQKHNFYTGCGERHCHWCNFVKRNELMDSLVDRGVEELDD